MKTENKERKIKLIWDFRGLEAAHIAKHHAIHLKDFIAVKKLRLNNAGFEQLTPNHSIAFLVVYESEMIPVRDALKPNRGDFYKD